jgi:hypothetical protein
MRFKKQPGGDPMQSKAQIDQMLRQKSDAVEIPGVVAVAMRARSASATSPSRTR